MSEVVEGEEIVVTGTRFKEDDSGGGGGFLFWFASYVPNALIDLFAQIGGGEVAQVVQFNWVGGDLIVDFPDKLTSIRLNAADRARMDEKQFADFVKTMTEYRDSPDLVATLDKMSALGLAELPVRFDTVIHLASGGTENWGANHYERMSMTYDVRPDGTIVNFKAVLNINSALVPGPDGQHDMWTNTQGESVPIDISLMILHGMRHAFYVGQADSEGQVRIDTDRMHDDIFRTGGTLETDSLSYLNGQTFIGSKYGDVSSGSAGNDTLSGFSGNDSLAGGAGDDLVLGGAGMDVLSGGTGSNLVMGGIDADTYVPAAGVATEMIEDGGGVDRLDLTRISVNSVAFARFGDSLVMSYTSASGYEQVQIGEQWIDGKKVEQFTFAEGTYAASYIEYLAGESGGVCYDGPNPVLCGPYGMPVVLDLDGDGIELIAVTESKARFDIDGDGARERIGWVGAGDGLLALDRNGNGRIDDFREISFLQDFLGAGSDLEGLLAYDSDHDGFLTAADARFSEFLVWRDANGNGHSEKNELYTLAEMGIASISLERRNIEILDLGADRNQILATSNFTMTDGRSFAVGDVALYADLARDCGCHAREPLPLFSSNGELPMIPNDAAWAG